MNMSMEVQFGVKENTKFCTQTVTLQHISNSKEKVLSYQRHLVGGRPVLHRVSVRLQKTAVIDAGNWTINFISPKGRK
jgi:hypothetical protein